MSAWNSPEHLHVALNHLPLIGTAAAAVPLLIGLVLKQRPLVLTGLFMVVLFAGSTGLVMKTGEEAEHRFEDGPLKGMLDEQSMEWMEVHEHRAHDWSKLAYGTAAFAALALIVIAIKPKAQVIMGLIALLATIATVAGMVWVADSGGKIRHPEFRTGPPPTQAHHDHGDHE